MSDVDSRDNEPRGGISLRTVLPLLGVVVGLALVVIVLCCDQIFGDEQTPVAIVMGVMLVAFVVNEARSFKKSVTQRRELYASNAIRGNEPLFMRIMTFFIYMAERTDCALIVLIAKELLGGSASSADAWLCTLPLTFGTAATLLGPPMFAFLSEHFRIKRLVFAWCAISLIGYLVCAYAVVAGEFVLLCLALLVANTAIQMVEIYTHNVVMRIKDQPTRNMLNEDITFGSMCGNVLSPLLASVAVAFVGYAGVYCLPPVFILVVMVIAFFAIPRTSLADGVGDEAMRESAQEREKAAQALDGLKNHAYSVSRFLLQFNVVGIVVFAFLGVMMLSGCKSVFFPLTADANGLSPSVISVLSVLSLAIPNLLAEQYSSLVRRFDNNVVMGVCLALGVAVYALMMLSESVVWQTVCMVVMTMLYLFSYISNNACIYDIVDRYDVSERRALSSTMVIHGGISVVVAPVMGAFAGLGFAGGRAVAAVAVFVCLALFVLSVLLKRKHFEGGIAK